jgi:hypothetical protein
MPSDSPHWGKSAERAELLGLYQQADALLGEWDCACSRGKASAPLCCQFAVTGREPYPTAVELEEVRYAIRMASAYPRDGRKLQLAPQGPCPLLANDGRCRIYPSRPFGCRTFFCRDAEGPAGSRARGARNAVSAVGRRIADLSARVAPHDPRARPLVRALLREAR